MTEQRPAWVVGVRFGVILAVVGLVIFVAGYFMEAYTLAGFGMWTMIAALVVVVLAAIYRLAKGR